MPKVDVFIDMGHPPLNLMVDGFLKIGAVGAARVAADESYHCMIKGSVSGNNFEHAVKKMCREGATWGRCYYFLAPCLQTLKHKTVAGVYVGMEYGIERVRGRKDWKNAMIGGELTGALLSAAKNNSRDKIVADAITGSAIATASVFVNRLS